MSTAEAVFVREFYYAEFLADNGVCIIIELVVSAVCAIVFPGWLHVICFYDQPDEPAGTVQKKWE